VTHAGGINTINDIPATLIEFVRVLRPNGTLLIIDEGLSPSARKTQRGLEIVKANKLFGLWPPLEHMPPIVKDIEVKWIARDTFFVIKCQRFSEDEYESVKVNGDESAQIRKMVDDMLHNIR
jgi:ubiquinone/menaquinone biosynthesis C-methylase UbiE